MAMNVYNVCGTIERNEIRIASGNREYRLLQIKPLQCNRLMTFFISPNYKSGEENKAYKTSERFEAGDKVIASFSVVNSSFFLFNLKEVKSD